MVLYSHQKVTEHMWLLFHYWTALLTKGEWSPGVLHRSHPTLSLVVEFFTSIPPGEVAQKTNSS